jgi:hypothetical protein
MRWLRIFAAIAVAGVGAGTYFWNAKETIADDSRGAWRYRVRVYRFRPITEFRFDHDANVYRSDEITFGATRVVRLDDVRWIGAADAVMLKFRADIDSGGAADRQLYYDFGTGAVLTTLNSSKDATRLDGALHQWMNDRTVQ